MTHRKTKKERQLTDRRGGEPGPHKISNTLCFQSVLYFLFRFLLSVSYQVRVFCQEARIFSSYCHYLSAVKEFPELDIIFPLKILTYPCRGAERRSQQSRHSTPTHRKSTRSVHEAKSSGESSRSGSAQLTLRYKWMASSEPNLYIFTVSSDVYRYNLQFISK
jgi:hypothetical protein